MNPRYQYAHDTTLAAWRSVEPSAYFHTLAPASSPFRLRPRGDDRERDPDRSGAPAGRGGGVDQRRVAARREATERQLEPLVAGASVEVEPDECHPHEPALAPVRPSGAAMPGHVTVTEVGDGDDERCGLAQGEPQGGGVRGSEAAWLDRGAGDDGVGPANGLGKRGRGRAGVERVAGVGRDEVVDSGLREHSGAHGRAGRRGRHRDRGAARDGHAVVGEGDGSGVGGGGGSRSATRRRPSARVGGRGESRGRHRRGLRLRDRVRGHLVAAADEQPAAGGARTGEVVDVGTGLGDREAVSGRPGGWIEAVQGAARVAAYFRTASLVVFVVGGSSTS